MEDLKTYFFIAGVSHEGNDKQWVKAEDAAAVIKELQEEIKFQRRINGEITNENQELRKGIKP